MEHTTIYISQLVDNNRAPEERPEHRSRPCHEEPKSFGSTRNKVQTTLYLFFQSFKGFNILSISPCMSRKRRASKKLEYIYEANSFFRSTKLKHRT
jgi:superfamily I DNA and/or RNA helicase